MSLSKGSSSSLPFQRESNGNVPSFADLSRQDDRPCLSKAAAGTGAAIVGAPGSPPAVNVDSETPINSIRDSVWHLACADKPCRTMHLTRRCRGMQKPQRRSPTRCNDAGAEIGASGRYICVARDPALRSQSYPRSHATVATIRHKTNRTQIFQFVAKLYQVGPVCSATQSGRFLWRMKAQG